MLLSRPCQYAISGVLRLGLLPPSGFCRVEDLVRGTPAPRHAVAKVFHTLARRNVLESVRGIGGGFRLPARSLDLSLMDVIEALEGPFEPAAPIERGLCVAGVSCPLSDLLDPIDAELRRVLRTTRVRDLLQRMGSTSGTSPCCPRCGASDRLNEASATRATEQNVNSGGATP